MSGLLKANRTFRLSVALNIVLILAVACAGAYKLYQSAISVQQDISYEENIWYAPCIGQARDLSELGAADVVMVGDSLTMYGLWQEFYPDVKVANRGIGGDVSEGVVNRLDTVTDLNPSKVFLMIGTNDVSRNYEQTDTVSNVKTTLDQLGQDLPNTEIYLQSVLPRLAKNADTIESLNREYKELAREYPNVTYVDLYPLYRNEEGIPKSELFASDGYHMSSDGYALWVEQIRRYVESRLD